MMSSTPSLNGRAGCATKNARPENTTQSYEFDLHNLFAFLNKHRARQVNLAMLSSLQLGDFRSWLANNAAENRQAASRARSVAGVRNFFRWLDRSGQLHNNAIELLKLPKTSRRLPRPVSESEAEDIVALAKNVPHENWVGLRDEALFTLLYGAGLRISEALDLTHADLSQKDRLTVTGKGSKQRSVPLLAIVRETLERYLAASPYAPKPNAGGFCRLARREVERRRGAAQSAPVTTSA